jgi:hypothetical protein
MQFPLRECGLMEYCPLSLIMQSNLIFTRRTPIEGVSRNVLPDLCQLTSKSFSSMSTQSFIRFFAYANNQTSYRESPGEQTR